MFINQLNYHSNCYLKQSEFCCHSLFWNKCLICSPTHTNNALSFGNNNIKPTINESIITDEPVIIDDIMIMDNASINNYSIKSDEHLVTDLVSERLDKIVSELSTNFDTKLHIKDDLLFDEDKDDTIMDDTNKKIIFAVDNDECIGSWGDLSLLYIMLKIELGHEPDIELFVDIMVKTCCIRPYVKDFFDKLVELKKKGVIYKIFMFTAASNSNGWVSYLCKILEKWYGQSFYDGIIYKEMIEEWHKFNNSDCFNDLGYIKNMNMIRELIDFKDGIDSQNFHFIAIDDRPANIINGIAIGVSAFKVAVNIIEVLRLYLPDKFDYLMSKYSKSINYSWENYLKNPHAFTNASRDIDFLLSLEHVNKIIFS